jgi:hypothetical protein
MRGKDVSGHLRARDRGYGKDVKRGLERASPRYFDISRIPETSK